MTEKSRLWSPSQGGRATDCKLIYGVSSAKFPPELPAEQFVSRLGRFFPVIKKGVSDFPVP